MAYIPSECTKEQYMTAVYDADAKHKCYLSFGGVEYEDVDETLSQITITSNLIDTTQKVFMLNNLVAKSIEITLHEVDTTKITDQIELKIGTYINDTIGYVYVPIGKFNLSETPTTSNGVMTIKARDNSVKLDTPYNAKPIIDAGGGKATKKQILDDICSTFGITHNITSFRGMNEEIGIYDNTINARVYVAMIAEQAGCFAYFDRTGVLNFVKVSDMSTNTWTLNYEDVSKLTTDTKYTIKKVIYESGVIKYEKGDTTGDILYLDTANDYINSQEIVDGIYDIVKDLSIETMNIEKIYGNPAIDTFDLIQCTDENNVVHTSLGQNTLTYNGKCMQTFDTQISNEKKETNITSITNNDQTFKKWARTTIDNVEAQIELTVGKVETITVEVNNTVKTVSKQYKIKGTTDDWSETYPTRQEGQVILAREKYTHTDGTITYGTEYEITGDKGDTGEKGEAGSAGDKGEKGDKGDKGDTGATGATGATGKGISKIDNYYARSTTQTAPSSITSTTIPTLDSTNKYLWQRKVITYTDNTTSEEVALIGVYGDTGAKGDTGASGKDGKDGTDGNDGRGISTINYYYKATTTQTTPSASEITSTTIPTLSSTNKYLWQKEITTFSDNTTDTKISLLAVYGDKGEQGIQGIQGPAGADGTSTYFYIRYSANESGNPMTTTPDENTQYMGVASTTSSTAPTSYTDYIWSKTKGNTGEQGIAGPTGADGKTSYIHYMYSEDGETFTPADTEYALGKKPSAYIGQYTDFTETDSTTFSDYNWYKFTENIDPILEEYDKQITNLNDELEENYYQKSQVEQLILNSETGLTNIFSTSGGNNLLNNTQPWFGSDLTWDYWKGEVARTTETDATYDYAFLLQNGTCYQEKPLANTTYTISFKYKKLVTLATGSVEINAQNISLSETSGTVTLTFDITTQNITFKMISDTDNAFEIYDLMLNYGSIAMPYTQSANELKSTNVSISENITVESNIDDTITSLGTRGLEGRNKSTNEIVFKQTPEGSYSSKIEGDSGAIAGLLISKVGNQTWLTGV